MKITISSIVEGGSLTRNREALKDSLKGFESKEVVITIETKKRKRSNSQNAYLWGVVYPSLQFCFKDAWGENMSIQQVHDFCKAKFNTVEKVNEETGECIYLPKSTSENSTTDQEVYHEEIRRFALEWFNAVIPLPNEQSDLFVSK